MKVLVFDQMELNFDGSPHHAAGRTVEWWVDSRWGYSASPRPYGAASQNQFFTRSCQHGFAILVAKQKLLRSCADKDTAEKNTHVC